MIRAAVIAIISCFVLLIAYIEYTASFLPSHMAKPNERAVSFGMPQLSTPQFSNQTIWKQEFGHPRRLSFNSQ